MEIFNEIIQLINLIPKSTAAVLKGLAIIYFFILSVRTRFLSRGKISKRKYNHFKSIREEYIEDKLNGFFALQQCFKTKLYIAEMEYILNSPNAYSIFSLLKDANGKYEFKDYKFISKVTKGSYILPVIGYFIFSSLLVFHPIIRDAILNNFNIESAAILTVNICVSLPVLLICLWSINKITCALKLEKLTDTDERKTSPKQTVKPPPRYR